MNSCSVGQLFKVFSNLRSGDKQKIKIKIKEQNFEKQKMYSENGNSRMLVLCTSGKNL